jgi:diguanylate cyclase (GGDEF)-like protein
MSAQLRRRRPTEPDRPGRLFLERLLQENAALIREVSELRVLRDLAYRDPLTGLRNQRYLDARLREELTRSERTGHGQGALIALDVDDFGALNARFGRTSGDAALRWLAKRFPETLRTADVCCRVGGDKFMLLLPDTDRTGAETAVVRLSRATADASGPRWLPIGFSAGIATWPDDARTMEDLIAFAQQQLKRDQRRHAGRRVRLRLVP